MEKSFSVKLSDELLEKFEAMEGTARERVEFLLTNQSKEKDDLYNRIHQMKRGNVYDFLAEMERCYKKFNNFIIVPGNVDTKDKAVEFLKLPEFSKERQVFSMGDIEVVRYYQRKV